MFMNKMNLFTNKIYRMYDLFTVMNNTIYYVVTSHSHTNFNNSLNGIRPIPLFHLKEL